ncbi:MAG: FHA domain-containing protein [Faecousia sp.]
MKIERCPQGHFFDGDRYDACPLCPPKPKPAPPRPVLPTVGWLVCTEEAWRGRDFRLHAGYNYIGSGPRADISIPWDPQLAPGNAAILGYDDTWKQYSFGPCGGHAPVRVNGKLILDAVVLSPGDRLTVGSTALLFVPLCGPGFSWESSEHQEE